jgi:hypothetical protein
MSAIISQLVHESGNPALVHALRYHRHGGLDLQAAIDAFKQHNAASRAAVPRPAQSRFQQVTNTLHEGTS